MRSSGIRRLGLSAAIVVTAFLVVVFISRPHNTAGPCPVTDRAMLADVPEASGLAVSRGHPGLLWTHNDSGNEAVLHAIEQTGTVRGKVQVPARLRDWEDVSAAPCNTGGACLYIGDIGDNEMSRRTIQVYRIAEPNPGDRQTGRPEVVSLTYPDGPHNAEAMFVADERIFIVTKDRTGMLYRSAAAVGDVLSAFNRARTNIKLQRIAQLDLVGVTDAEMSPDGATVAVRTADEVVMYAAADLMRGNIAARVRIPVDGLREPQGEGVALGENGMLYLASEGRPWNRAGRFISLRCEMATGTGSGNPDL
jgi:hypothetical protein